MNHLVDIDHFLKEVSLSEIYQKEMVMEFFKNKIKVMNIGNEDAGCGMLKIQNSMDRIAIGTLDITRDDIGLKNVRLLLELFGQIEAALLAERQLGALPKRIKMIAPADADSLSRDGTIV